MPTGYEVKMYNDINRIANCLEAAERRARERDERYPRPLYDPEVVEELMRHLGWDKPKIDPNSLGAMALWREQVAAGDCLIGFADWLAWHQADNATTPEDIEAMAPAVQAVKRGFESMEQAVREQREGKDG